MFDAAWRRQPEARSLQARQDAAAARKEAAASWTAEPVALELSGQTDQMNNNLGRREYTAGVAIPLWLPNERSRSMAVAEAEQRATASSTLLAQLQTAAEVREAYWSWQLARIGFVLARERLLNAQQLTADVSRRVRAGDLARADQHQAEGAQAGAEAELAEAASELAAAGQRLRALSGLTLPADATAQPEALLTEPAPELVRDASALGDRHPAVMELLNRAEIARRSAELAQARTRGTPELMLVTGRDRGAFGDSYLRDHGKKVDVSNATATLTLLNGADKQEVALVPQGEWLGAAGDFKVAKGTKAVAVVKQAGKTVTVRFVLP